MGLLYKPDWDKTKERFCAWWAGEALGRCAIAVTAPKDGAEGGPPPTAPTDPAKRWTDLQYIAELNELQHSRTFYGGEAFPIWSGGYPGHTSIPTFLGSPITLDLHTGWHEPFLTGADWRIEDIRLGKNLHISIPAHEVETALKELSARGLFIATSCRTEAEARELLANAEKRSHD